MAQETAVFRSPLTRAIGAATVALAGFGLVSMLATGAWSTLWSAGPVLGLVALVGWAALWAPYVEVSDGGVVLGNVLRTVRLPWPAILEVDGRFGLRLETAYGRFTGWAAPAPTGMGRARQQQSPAAGLVADRLERLRGAGHLDRPRLESDSADVRWHWAVLVVGAALLVGAVLGLVLG